MSRVCVFVLLMVSTSFTNAQEINPARALYNYQMSCQGCHGPEGNGGGGVPGMQGFVGLFLNTTQGREFLVQVPGSANSALTDSELAEVLNWMIGQFGGLSNPSELKPYTANEVARLRLAPLNEVDAYRAMVLANIAQEITREAARGAAN